MTRFIDSGPEAAHPPRDPATIAMQRAYKLWAPVYDAICGPLFLSSRRVAARMARSCGRQVLEIGVGTGLSLPDYGPENEVWGIDLSPEMIEKAKKRVADEHLPARCTLEVIDAHSLPFEDDSFHAVAAQFVITLVENPERVLDECLRVVAPGGEIILVNHFYSETGLAAWIERRLATAAHGVGLRPDFRFGRIEDWMAARGGVSLIERQQTGVFGAFSVVRLRKHAEPASFE